MNELTSLDKMPSKIDRLKDAILQLPQVEPLTNHYFAKGMYARTIFSPAGTVIVGKRHKTEHFYMVLSGRVNITFDDKVIEINATKDGPQIFTCPPGTRRAVYVVEDSWRMNIHLNNDDEMDLDKLESHLVEDDPSSPFLVGNSLKKEVLK